MINVRFVANWFLSKSSMSQKKLQTLCYYAQAWHCAFCDGEKLFEDEIQAWVGGPVTPILHDIFGMEMSVNIPQIDFDEDLLPKDVLDLLDTVYETYGGLSDTQLEHLVHGEEPWQAARGDLKPWEPCYEPISCEKMSRYYHNLLAFQRISLRKGA